jgi:hypothetical protein
MIVKLSKWMDFQDENQIHQAKWSRWRLKFYKLYAKTFSADRQQLKENTCKEREREKQNETE